MPRVAQSCVICGTRLEGRRWKYCSPECSRISEYQQGAPVTTEPCEWCGKNVERRRYKLGRRRFCDHQCRMAYRVCVTDDMASREWPRTQPCTECGRRYPTASSQPRRCPECAAAYVRAHAESLKFDQPCQDCGEIVRAGRGLKRCKSCKRDYQREKNKSRRKRRGDRGYAHKRRAYIIKRDGGRCQVCRKRVVIDQPLHPRAAEVDHIIPVSLWPEDEPGLNRPTNLRLLCRTCNSQKSNGTAPNGDQLMLIG